MRWPAGLSASDWMQASTSLGAGKTSDTPIFWVGLRLRRADLVHACLVLCQAWIAAGRPLGLKKIGSYENWSHVMGGVLDVIGVDGFLANLDEVLAAVDGEGAEWRGFVSAWWQRFKQLEVGTKELFEIAQQLEGLTALGTGNDHSQRTRLGKALGRIRDRVFDLGDVKLRVCAAGLSHQANRWRLSAQESASTPPRTSATQAPEESHERPVGERGEGGERVPARCRWRCVCRWRLPTVVGAAVQRIRRSPRSPRSPVCFA